MNVFLLLLSVVADLASGRGKNELAESLGLLGDLVKAGKEGSAEFEELCVQIQGMVDEGRDPSPAELAAVRTRRAELSSALQGLGNTDGGLEGAGHDDGSGGPDQVAAGPGTVETNQGFGSGTGGAPQP